MNERPSSLSGIGLRFAASANAAAPRQTGKALSHPARPTTGDALQRLGRSTEVCSATPTFLSIVSAYRDELGTFYIPAEILVAPEHQCLGGRNSAVAAVRVCTSSRS
jgi:hypothetical protein